MQQFVAVCAYGSRGGDPARAGHAGQLAPRGNAASSGFRSVPRGGRLDLRALMERVGLAVAVVGRVVAGDAVVRRRVGAVDAAVDHLAARVGQRREDKVEQRFTLDELITNAMIYWVSGSIGSAMSMYFETARAVFGNPGIPKPARSNVPAAVARMPSDAPMPREWAERKVNLAQWSEPARGSRSPTAPAPWVTRTACKTDTTIGFAEAYDQVHAGCYDQPRRRLRGRPAGSSHVGSIHISRVPRGALVGAISNSHFRRVSRAKRRWPRGESTCRRRVTNSEATSPEATSPTADGVRRTVY